jgi:hypothetical protein
METFALSLSPTNRRWRGSWRSEDALWIWDEDLRALWDVPAGWVPRRLVLRPATYGEFWLGTVQAALYTLRQQRCHKIELGCDFGEALAAQEQHFNATLWIEEEE